MVAALISGCGKDPAAARSAGAPVRVAAAFYPLEYVARRVGGDGVTVTSLTKPGAEPHDLELSPKDVAAVTDAELVVYLAQFQPAVDETVKSKPDRALDVTAAARADLTSAAGAEGHEDDHGDEHDPHFWLDPMRLADVADAVAARLTQADASRAASFSANAATLRADLTALDAEFRAGLTSCASRRIVTTHTAFGYLAAAYGLTQIGVSGIDPEAEPKPADIARVQDVVRKEKVTTVFFEPLVSRGVADTIARETGAKTALLDPLEGINDQSQGSDYLAVMRSNLTALRSALGCP